MFASKPKDPVPAQIERARSSPASASGRQPLAALGQALNGGARAAGLAQIDRTLNPPSGPVVQRMKVEERQPFVDEAVERAEKRGFDGEDLRNIKATARLLSMRDISVDEAVRKMEIEFHRVGLRRGVDRDEEQDVPKRQTADRLAGLFGTSVDAVVARYVGPFRDEGGALPPGFEAAVTHWAEAGARDVEANLTDTLAGGLLDGDPKPGAYMDQLDRYISANIDFGRFYGKVDGALGNVIHFIWSGRPISKTALANIESWAERAKGTSWQVVMWSDAEISDWVKAKPILERSHVRLLDVTGVVDPRFRDAYAFARKHNLAGASDLIRLSLLKRFGGMYVDVDIGPGEVDLAKATTPGPLERPLLAPGIRDSAGVRTLLGLPPDTAVTKDHVDEAVRRLRRDGTLNNNFISSAPNSIGMNPIINHIARGTSAMNEDAWEGSGGFIAGVSGPMAIGGVLDRMARRGQLPSGKPSDTVTKLPLQWLTPDSEDQDWGH